jgi:hypothetical protein
MYAVPVERLADTLEPLASYLPRTETVLSEENDREPY